MVTLSNFMNFMYQILKYKNELPEVFKDVNITNALDLI